MTTVKELFENNDLMNNIVEDMEDFVPAAEIFYVVWALGYNRSGEITDTEVLLGEFEDSDEAIRYVEELTINDITSQLKTTAGIAYFSVEVETVIADPDDEDGGTMNIGTIYRKELEVDVVDVVLTSDHYTLLEDGNLQIPCAHLMEYYNKNDCIKVMFADEDNKPVLTYKIISKTTANDFICEFID